MPRLVVGISGASGAIYGARLLELLHKLPVETHLVMTRSAELTLALETELKAVDLRARADAVHAIGDLAAPISSGSFRTIGMIVAPCSIRSMAEIATGATTTLLTRAADVTLKERRLLVLMVRETPLHTGHLRTMAALSEMGAVIAPPVPAFYAKPQSLAEMIDHTLGRVLDLFGLDSGTVRRWGEPGIALGAPHQQSDRAAQHSSLRRLALGAETAGQIGQRRRKPVAQFALRRVRQGFRGDTAGEPALNLPLGGKFQPQQRAPQRPDIAVAPWSSCRRRARMSRTTPFAGAAASAAAANPSLSRSRP